MEKEKDLLLNSQEISIEEAIATATKRETLILPKGKWLDFYYEKATSDDLDDADEFTVFEVEEK